MTPRRLLLDGDAVARGTTHGAAHRDEIRRYADERVRLAGEGTWSSHPMDRDEVLDLADGFVSTHRSYDADLTDEMEAMADAVGLSMPEAVIVGGFTDFIDVVRAAGGDPDPEDNCTSMLIPPAVADQGCYLGQTWDMHDTATQHIVLLELEPDDAPRALVFTTVGCLGQIGMNDAGIAVGINNLTTLDGRPGVTWPHVVRKALKQTDVDDALACVTEAPLAGAHNFLLLNAEGRGYNVEATPTRTAVTELGDEPLVHTNHCLDPATQAVEAQRAEGLVASSRARLARATELLRERPVGVEQLQAITRDDEAVCQRAVAPYHIESCGGAVMSPPTGEFWAVAGIPADNDYELFKL